jgi:hypothetical protein
MLKHTLALAALLAALAACSVAAQTTDALAPADAPLPVAAETAPAPIETAAAYTDEAAAVSCEVRSRRTANGVIIQARAFADRNIDGEYDLRIIKSGGGNSSEISQSGPLTLAAGAAATLGENEVSLERGARIRAVLTLRDASGEICSRTFRL